MNNLPRIFACRKCGRIYSLEEYTQSRFCRDCDTYLILASKLPEHVRRAVNTARRRRKDEPSGWLPENYEIREGQREFTNEATRAIKENQVFLGSAPCGIGKSLASLLAVLPQLKDNKLLISFRTKSQLRIFLKELKALGPNLTAVSFSSKQSMCPFHLRENLSYFDFFEECKRLKDNSESSRKPQCKFYAHIIKKKREAEELALECARRFLSPLEAVQLMSERGFCAYEALRRILGQVRIFLGTYHYLFNSRIREATLKSFGADLTNVFLIVDEAHNLPAFSRDLLSDKLFRTSVERAITEATRFQHESSSLIQEYLTLINDDIFQRAQQSLRNREVKRLNPSEISDLFLDISGVSGLEAATTLREYGEYVREKRQELGHERLLSYNFRVGEFMENFFENTEARYIHLLRKGLQDKIALEVKCLDGRQITDSVFRRARGSIIMSGSFSPLKIYKDLMLYDHNNVQLKEFNSPFPAENRLIITAKDVSSRYKSRTKQMLEKWKNYIEAISEANLGNMAVFFTSYELMHKILPLIKTRRNLIIEGRKTRRERVIKELKSSTNNTLLGVMGAKFSEGMDYPNNLLTCVVIVGFPYATWNVYQRALIDYYDRQFPGNGEAYAYQVPAILRLIQASGRVHRSAHDKGCIVILDERVARQPIKQQLPNYFQKEMEIVKTPLECAEKIKRFWKIQFSIKAG